MTAVRREDRSNRTNAATVVESGSRAVTFPSRSIEIEAFVPARDVERSERFYLDMTFEIPWPSDEIANVRHDETSFLLQRFDHADHAANVMIHRLVGDVAAWWPRVRARDIVATYGVTADASSDEPWGMRDFRAKRE